MSDFPPELLELFEFGNALGEGTTGRVYRARQLALSRDVVVKVISDSGGRDSVDRIRWRREAAFIAELKHPHIVDLLDFGEGDDWLYLVYPDDASESLDKESIAARFYDPKELRRLLIESLDALAVVHSKDIIHRDLKPANLLMQTHGQIQLIDFGIATKLQEAGNLTASQEFVGTPAYVSPDRIRGVGEDPRDDLYSLGVIAYKLLTKSNPFLSDTVVSTLNRVVRYDPKPLSEVRPDVPRGLAALIHRMMEKNRKDRPKDALTLKGWLLRQEKRGPERVTKSTQQAVGGTQVLPVKPASTGKRKGKKKRNSSSASSSPKKTLPRHRQKRKQRAKKTLLRVLGLCGLGFGMSFALGMWAPWVASVREVRSAPRLNSLPVAAEIWFSEGSNPSQGQTFSRAQHRIVSDLLEARAVWLEVSSNYREQTPGAFAGKLAELRLWMKASGKTSEDRTALVPFPRLIHFTRKTIEGQNLLKEGFKGSQEKLGGAVEAAVGELRRLRYPQEDLRWLDSLVTQALQELHPMLPPRFFAKPEDAAAGTVSAKSGSKLEAYLADLRKPGILYSKS